MKKSIQTEQLPPHSEEAEQGVLGCCLRDGDGIDEAVERLPGPQVFYDTRHQKIYLHMLAMFEDGQPIDTLTLTEHLKSAGALDEAGGAGYVSTLEDMVPSAHNLPMYLDIVREKFFLRRLIQICVESIQKIRSREDQAQEVVDAVERDLLTLSETRVRAAETSVKELVKKIMSDLEDYERGGPKLRGLTTGFGYLDKTLLGMAPGDMLVLAARPGMGKTSIGLQIISHLAVDLGVPCAIFTLEMTAEQLAQRLLFQHCRGDFQRFRTGFMEKKDTPGLVETGGKMMKAPLWLDGTSGINVLELRARARRLRRQHGIQCIMVDYLQLMRPSRFYPNREQEVAEISGGLKSLAKELQIPVIVLAQLNRDIERNKGRGPTLADLRESGAIEQDADVVGILHEPRLGDDDEALFAKQVNDGDWSKTFRPIYLRIAKQRNGPTGECKFLYRKASMRFEEIDFHSKEPPKTGERKIDDSDAF